MKPIVSSMFSVTGGAALVFRNLPAAERAFREAVSMDPQLPDAWGMLARLSMARRDLSAAAAALTGGIAVNPAAATFIYLSATSWSRQEFTPPLR